MLRVLKRFPGLADETLAQAIRYSALNADYPATGNLSVA
jgi:hypothetical protein